MRGLRLQRVQRVRVETRADAAVATFAQLFEPVLPRLGSYHWLFRSDLPFQWHPEDAEYEAALASLGDIVEPGVLLPRFARYVREDWADMFGFLAPPPSRDAFLVGLEAAVSRDHAEYRALREPDGITVANAARYYQRLATYRTTHLSTEASYLAARVDVCFYNVDGAFWEAFSADNSFLDAIEHHARATTAIICTPLQLHTR